MHRLFLPFLCCCLMFSPVVSFAEERLEVSITADQSSCQEIAALARKYGADSQLPDEVVVDGKPCPRGEVAHCFLSVIVKLLEKCEKEGVAAIPPEEMERIAALHEALKDDLVQLAGYVTLRETIEKMLAKPDDPSFLFKVGVDGFLRGEGAGNFRLPDFSYNPGHGEGRFLYRVKPYAYWHPTGWLDIHAEGQGYGFSGGSQYAGKVSLYQGFAEAHWPEAEGYSLKAGRQEFVYGSAFVLGNDSFYDGLSFDALRVRLAPLKPLTIDLFGGWYATPFSDGVKGELVGGYGTWTFSEGNALEAYALRDTGSGEHHAGEHRDTWGVRGMATFGPVALEVEPVFQTGRLFNPATDGNENISAYGGHADISFDTTLWGYHNHLFASYALGSGDSDAATGGSFRREFSNPNTDSPLTGDMNVIGSLSGIDVGDHHASGLRIHTLGWGIDITREVNFSATGRYFRASYVEPGFSKNLGVEADFTLTYAFSDNLSFVAGYDRFFTGGFFRDATGSERDIDYGYVMLQFDLSHAKPKLRMARK
ncbi:alginate export family protein [Geomobilimonas luticola]|nr:alginate export family protein [Geomobilimonas luticola]